MDVKCLNQLLLGECYLICVVEQQEVCKGHVLNKQCDVLLNVLVHYHF